MRPCLLSHSDSSHEGHNCCLTSLQTSVGSANAHQAPAVCWVGARPWGLGEEPHVPSLTKQRKFGLELLWGLREVGHFCLRRSGGPPQRREAPQAEMHLAKVGRLGWTSQRVCSALVLIRSKASRGLVVHTSGGHGLHTSQRAFLNLPVDGG